MAKIMKKRIEEAAMRNATCRFYDDDDEILDISVKSFEDGALWRINSVWHKPSEMPNRNIDKYGTGEDVLVKAKCNDFIEMCTVYEEPYSPEEFELLNDRSSYSMDDIEKWAYVSDLVPLSMINKISRKPKN